MSKTYLEIVNGVQQRLRTNVTGSVTSTTNSKIIAKIVNDAKREVEDAWNWKALRQTLTITTVSGTYQYALTGFGKRGRVLRDIESGKAAVFNDTDDYTLTDVPSAYVNRQRYLSTGSNSPPTYWAFEGQDSNDDPYVIFYQTPDDVYNIRFNCVIPQDDLVNDSDTLSIPYWPVEHLTWAYAVEERGEDRGVSRGEIFDRAYKSIADLIALDSAGLQRELDFHVT